MLFGLNLPDFEISGFGNCILFVNVKGESQ